MPKYDAAIWDAKGSRLFEQRRFDEALAAFARGLARDPDAAELWIEDGLEMSALQRHS